MSNLTTPPRAIFRQIQANLKDRYSSGFPVLKELIQNAEDAKAGMIRFVAHEGSYELCVKMLRRFLEMTEPNPAALDDATFQSLIRLGSERGLLKSDLAVWMDFRRQRGTTSHAYDAAKAAQVHAVIPAFLADARFLLAELHRRSEGL